MNQKITLKLLADVTQHTKYEKYLYLVGGSVRDWLLDRTVDCDYDIVTELDAVELADMLYQSGCLDNHPIVYPRFGTVKLSIAGDTIELVTARKESYQESTRKPEVERASLRDDVFRRDFTINCLLYNLHTQEVLDLTGFGIRDLHLGVLRTPLPPHQTFHDDPLRIMRAARFLAQLGFEPVEPLEQAAREMASRLGIVSGERIREELRRTIDARYAADGLYAMKEWGIWPVLMGSDTAPEVDWITAVPRRHRWPYALFPLCGELANVDRLIKRLRFSRHEASALHAFGRVVQNTEHIDTLVSCHAHLSSIIEVSTAAGILPERQLELLRGIGNRKPVSPIDGREIAELRPDLPVTDIGRIKAHLVKMVVTDQVDPSDQESARQEVLRWSP
ncbi:MAG: CCA tRNA nucleotidyltransferase [Armatimonadota bacterium]